MPGFHYTDEPSLSEEAITQLIAPVAVKFAWFLSNGYVPHYYQSLFHTMRNEVTDGMCRFRHLVAGRRGGKTLSAAWELAFYVTHPEEFHWDFHRKKASRPLHVWVVTKDFPTGHPALTAFREVLRLAGLEAGQDYKENRGNHWFEFANGSFVHFRSAEDPQSLRGAGLDILWIDEAAFIPNREAWDVARPALSDKLGAVWTTTTPDGKNWLWEEFFTGEALTDPRQGRVEYRSIDNPHFPEEEWLYLLQHYHPLLFKREYMASFDAFAGKELSGDWLHYWTPGDPKGDEITPPRVPERPSEYDLTTYVAVDPAISLADSADRFVICLLGVSKDNTQAYLLDMWAGRIPFPEQVDMIRTWFQKYRPSFIAVEAQAYQRALEQQANRLEGFPAVVPIFSHGKKSERILSMAPLFKIGKVRIRRDHTDFIDEWLDYDSTRKNPKDDCLDAVEIALRAAGILLPMTPSASHWDTPAASVDELAWSRMPGRATDQSIGLDEHLGGEW